MIKIVENAGIADLKMFDDIIDVRSPAEFAEDHIPRAINLPVLDDAQRAEVGTIYVQESKFEAKRIGAALIAENIAKHLRVALADKPGSFAPLIYCWRGGQRSNAMATILSQIGWRASVLKGGYKTYRRNVIASLYDAESEFQMVLLEGNTGTAKTEILLRLAGQGVQVIDLEGLAAHRGSIFGGLAAEKQPRQRMFESKLLNRLNQMDFTRPILCEAESSKIGDIILPPTIWKAMLAAPAIELTAKSAARSRYLVTAYGDIIADKARLESMLDGLVHLQGQARVDGWKQLAVAGRFEALAGELIEHHYDPSYFRSRRRNDRTGLGMIQMPSLDEAGQNAVMREITSLLDQFCISE